MKLTEEELNNIGKMEGVKFDQGNPKPLYLMGRYDQGGSNEKRLVFLELDTGSDRTILGRGLAERIGLKLMKFKNPKVIIGVGNRRVECDTYGVLNLMVRTIKGNEIGLTILCYIMDNVPSLLGNDVLAKLGCSISFEFNLLTYGGNIIELHTDRSKLEKKIALLEGREKKEIKFYLENTCKLSGGKAEVVNVKLSHENFVDPVLALIGNRDDVCVVDMAYDKKVDNYTTVLYNMSTKPITIKRGAELGFVLKDSEETNIYNLNDFRNDQILKMKEYEVKDEVKVGLDQNDLIKDNVIKDENKVEVQKNEGEEGPLKSFPDRRKLNAKEMDRLFEHGIDLDVRADEGKPLNIEFPEVCIDEAAELKRNEEDVKWKDRNEFLSHFKWDVMRKEITKKCK